MDKEALLRRIKKVRELATRGEHSEKEAAEKMLKRLMKKHNITEAELSQEKLKTVFFPYHTEEERRLLSQIIYAVTGCSAYGCIGTYTGRKRKKVGVDCTEGERIEIEASFEFYNAALKEEYEFFFTAFVNKNDIFPPPDKMAERDGQQKEITRAEAFKLSQMMNAMDKRTRRLMIEENTQAGSSEEI